ncbi:MAG TPA: hypothetical protein VHY48_01010 [Acidobacteriaceae bacterium]|jgi:hypothetical protein|nr:hypothetical protein [Acidobacteriaceae bacterium]
MAQPYPRWFYRALFVLMVLAILVRLFYWHYTDRTWEDALITVLHSENFVRGLGLTHLQPAGEPPLHGFTSPLSVLIPLVGDLVHVGWGLPFLKLISALCGAIAVWFGARICQVLELSPAATLTAAAFLAFEHHQIMWGMAGMETQVTTVAYLCSIYAMMRGTQWQKGLSLGFAMLARPDAAIWVAIAFLVEMMRTRKTANWRRLVPMASGLVLLYGPWILFTLLYYGSPIPNTIIAKSMGYPSVRAMMHGLPPLAKAVFFEHRAFMVLGSLGPGYEGNGTGLIPFWDHGVIALLMVLFCAAGLVVALRKRHAPALLLYSFVIAYTLYLIFCPSWVAGWYTAPVVAVAVLGSMYGLWTLTAPIARERSRERILAWVGGAYIVSIVSVLPFTMRSDKYIQQYVEDGGRKQIGLYFVSVSLPTDTIGTESLGYIGYYSRRVIYDYPGLCSRPVIRYLRSHPNPQDHNLTSMMNALRPTYLVLRPGEYENPDGQSRLPWIEQDYELVRVFKVPEEDRKKILHHEASSDFEFDVFRKKGAPGRATAPS